MTLCYILSKKPEETEPSVKLQVVLQTGSVPQLGHYTRKCVNDPAPPVSTYKYHRPHSCALTSNPHSLSKMVNKHVLTLRLGTIWVIVPSIQRVLAGQPTCSPATQNGPNLLERPAVTQLVVERRVSVTFVKPFLHNGRPPEKETAVQPRLSSLFQ